MGTRKLFGLPGSLRPMAMAAGFACASLAGFFVQIQPVQATVTTRNPEDLLIGHIGGIDCCARGLKAAAKMIEDKALSKPLTDRYAGWNGADAQAILRGEVSLEQLAAKVEKDNINPEPRSGRQEYLENVVNRYV